MLFYVQFKCNHGTCLELHIYERSETNETKNVYLQFAQLKKWEKHK